ncbi:MAG: PQQ-binding-like beta-propeller repeat protein [Terrimicrobiaceae bacterium]
MNDSSTRSPIRWWPAIAILGLSAVAIGVARLWSSVDFQIRYVAIFVVIAVALLMLTIWWLLFSRAPWRMRLTVFALVLALGGALSAAFRWRGVTGDFVHIFELRWRRHAAPTPPPAESRTTLAESGRPDFPQYLGPQRNGVISDGPALARDWQKEPPQVLWRQPIGTAWSGFAIVGNRAVTLEQRGEQETVTCLDVLTGKQLWAYGYTARFDGSYSGEGPRATPTIADGRVYTLGATGLVSCVTLNTGALVWQRDLYKDAKGGRPEWGYAGSPLVLDGKVIVSSGKSRRRSLFAYSVADGKIVWRDGSQPGNYSSPCLLNLAGVPQIVMFNMTNITAHEPKTGAVLWEYPWGVRQPQIAQPVPVGPNRVAFSSSYGVGTELLEIKKDDAGKLSAHRVWKTLKFRVKMSSFIHRDGYFYGLNDGILACIDARDGSPKWKEGRYGHGQILLVGDLLLVTAENGEIILLAPTPEAPNELTRFRVFSGKTWNPPALSGDLLLMRTDQEAACLRLPLARQP